MGNYFFLFSNSSYILSLASSASSVQIENEAAVASDVLSYVKGNSPAILNSALFRPEELSHLSKVKARVLQSFLLFFALALLTTISAAILAYPHSSFEKLMPVFSKGIGISGMAVVAIAVLIWLFSLDFSPAFDLFHIVFFSNDQWQFPSDYLLVNLFTEGFFFSFASAVVFASFAQGVVMVLSAVLLGRAYGKK